MTILLTADDDAPLAELEGAREESAADAAADSVLWRFERLFAWAGLPARRFGNPRAYRHPGAASMMQAAGAERICRVGCEPLERYAPLPSARNAISMVWPYHALPQPDALATTGPFGDEVEPASRIDVVLAGTDHTAMMAAQLGAAAVVRVPPPIGPEAGIDIDAAAAPRASGDTTELTVWTPRAASAGGVGRDDPTLAPTPLAAFLDLRVGPLIVAQVDPARERAATLSLLSAARGLSSGRLLLLIDGAPRGASPGQALAETLDLEVALEGLGARIALAETPIAAAGVADLARVASFWACVSFGTTRRAQSRNATFLTAAAAGAVPITPQAATFSELAAADWSIAAPAIRKRMRPDQPDPRDPFGRGDPQHWIPSGAGLSEAFAAAEGMPAAERTERAAAAAAWVRDHATFEVIWRRLGPALGLRSAPPPEDAGDATTGTDADRALLKAQPIVRKKGGRREALP